MTAPMKVAFVANSYLDPGKPTSWSGLPFFIRHSLESAGVEVETFVLPEPNRAQSLLRYAYWRFVRGKRYLRACEVRVLKHYAREIERSLVKMKPDAVFCPSTWPAAFLHANIPTVFWTDACFAGMVNFYESFSNLAPCSVVDGHAAEYAALRNCTRAIFSSTWAAETARESYLADPAKIRIVPFGANIVERPSNADVEAFVAQRDLCQCNLLLIGVDWERKGALIAVETVRALNERGLPARLTIVGCVPPPSLSLPPNVEVIPFISKVSLEGARRFNGICRRSHFLLMPSRADCTPVAIAEGNCFGLPCLATDVGGIPSLVANDVNGRLFDLRARGMTYADHIIGLMREPVRYRSLAVNSARYANKHFSWETSGAKVAAIIAEVIPTKTHSPARGAVASVPAL
jgi:glycosyltransferase involved in cell wall biosynthesis